MMRAHQAKENGSVSIQILTGMFLIRSRCKQSQESQISLMDIQDQEDTKTYPHVIDESVSESVQFCNRDAVSAVWFDI